MPFTFQIPRNRDRTKRGECRVRWRYYYKGKEVTGACTYKTGENIIVPCKEWISYNDKINTKRERYGRARSTYNRARLINSRLDDLESMADWILDTAMIKNIIPTTEYFNAAWTKEFADNPVFECFDMYLKVKHSEGVSKSTLGNYRKLKKHLENFDKNIRFTDFDHGFPTRYKLSFPELSPNSIILDMRNIKSFLRYGMLMEWHDNRKFEGWKLKGIKGREFYLEADEIRQMIDADLEGTYDKCRDILVLLIYTGLRWSELARLREVNSQSSFSRLFRYRVAKQKLGNDKYVTFELSPGNRALAIWDKYRGELPIVKKEDGTPAKSNHFNRWIKKVAMKAGIDPDRAGKITAHVARHTFITLVAGDSTRDEIAGQTGQTHKVIGNYDHSQQVSIMPGVVDRLLKNKKQG